MSRVNRRPRCGTLPLLMAALSILGVVTTACGTEAGSIERVGPAESATTDDTVSDRPDRPGAEVAALAAANTHTCAVDGTGQAFCWGDNASGQLGNGTTRSSSTPTAVPGMTDVVDIDASWDNTCALTGDGTVFCWGDNDAGQLGDGTTEQRSEPTRVAGLEGITAIGVGLGHACAVTPTTSVVCWGRGDTTGRGPGPDQPTPIEVPGVTGAVDVSGAPGQTCAVLADGGVICWGYNSDASDLPPTRISGVDGTTKVVGSEDQWCALIDDGTVMCWSDSGPSLDGVGDPDGTVTGTPRPVPVPDISDAIDVAVGSAVTCILRSDGRVSCRGYTRKLGRGETDEEDPQYIEEPLVVPDLDGVERLAGGPGTMFALLGGGGFRCWGPNTSGQLGDGTTTDRWRPGPLVDLG